MGQGRIRGVAFDLDGVLIDSAGCHRAAFEEVLERFGVLDFHYARYAGWRTLEVIETELRRAAGTVDPDTIEAAAKEKSRLAREKLAATNPVPDDCLPVLRQLAGEYALALASSGSRGSVDIFLTSNGCRDLFQSILTGDDVVWAKPDPEIYRRTFDALRLDPASCVVVEDAIAGIHAALGAGAMAVGFAGTCPKERLQEAGAVYVVDRLSELPDLLSRI
jgi:HAD superfamily hydrolase (TIGR01509 family)